MPDKFKGQEGRVLRGSCVMLWVCLLVAPLSAARGGDTLIDLAHRFTAPVEPSPEGSPSPVPQVSPFVVAATTQAAESQSLGAPGRDGLMPPSNRAAGGVSITSGSWVMDTLTALGVVLGLVLAMRWMYVRWAGRGGAVRPSPVVEVLSRSAVAPRNHVLLLRVGSRILVVSDSSGGMRTLADIDEPEEVASLIGAVSASRDNSVTRSFARLFHSFNSQYDRQTLRIEGGDDGEHRVDRARDAIGGLLTRVRLMAGKGGGA